MNVHVGGVCECEDPPTATSVYLDSVSTNNTTRNVLLSAQMGEQVSVVLICIITSRYNKVK